MSLSATERFARLFAVTLIICALLICTGCTEDNNDSPDVPDIDNLPLKLQEIEGVTAEDGSFVTEFTLRANVSGLQLVAQAPSSSIQLVGVVGPDDQVLFDAADSFDAASTTAENLQTQVNVVNLPIIGRSDGSALKAGTYIALYQTKPLSNTQTVTSDNITLSILTKLDGDLTQGALPLKVVLPGSIANSDASYDAVKNALNVAREILQRGGLSLQEQIVADSTMPNALPNPAQGDPYYKQFAESNNSVLTLFIGSSVKNLKSPLNPIAQAGSNPGALVPTLKTGIAASFSAAAGSDQVIDSEDDRSDPFHTSEVRLFGEAIAHEILHSLGLQDSLTFTGSIATGSDVTDSPKCPTLDECRLDKDAPHNIMFPFPLDRDRANSDIQGQDNYIPREYISDGQAVITQYAIGVQ